MGRKIKILIIFWFFFSWAILIIFTLKPIGVINTIKLMVAPLIRNISIPKEWIICDFEEPRSFSKWYCTRILMESSQEHTSRGEYSAKITYYANQGISSIMLEDYNLGPMGIKDWSFFKFFNFTVFNPQNIELSLHIKIKDQAGRTIDKIWDLKPGENKVTFILEEIGQFIDLGNIIYLNFYILSPEKDLILYLDNLHLERRDLKEKRILDQPIVNFVRLSAPPEVKKGNSIIISALLLISKELNNDYRVFIHISNSQEINKRPSQRKWYINADQDPWIPTSKWMINIPYEIGPVSIYIPKDFPIGEYIIQMGIFNPVSSGSYYKGSSFSGMMDFRAGYPRLNYTNKEIKNYIVGRIRVLN